MSTTRTDTAAEAAYSVILNAAEDAFRTIARQADADRRDARRIAEAAYKDTTRAAQREYDAVIIPADAARREARANLAAQVQA